MFAQNPPCVGFWKVCPVVGVSVGIANKMHSQVIYCNVFICMSRFLSRAATEGDLRAVRLYALACTKPILHGTMYAASHGHLAYVRFMARMANTNDVLSDYAYACAANNNHFAVVRYLLDCEKHVIHIGVFGKHLWLASLHIRRYLVWRYPERLCCGCGCGDAYVCL
jgi:hypothetical protein